MNLHVPVLFIPHFLNASTDTVSYAVRDQNVLRKGEGAKPGMKILLITGIICNFISIQIADFLDLQNIKIFLEFWAT